MMTRHDGRSSRDDAQLDRLLAATQAELSDYIDARLELDAGLAAIIGDPGAEQVEPAADDGHSGELELVCGTLAGLAESLQPVVEAPGTASMSFLMRVHQLLAELHDGLAQRRLSKTEAARLVRLIGHNLGEAAALMRSEAARARRKRARRRVEELQDLAGDLEDRITDLQPRIMRLFDEADDTAPKVPAGHGPS